MYGKRPVDRHQQGLTLIEVLITMVIVSVGILSVAVLQIKASQYSQASFQRSIAIVQASDLVERVWGVRLSINQSAVQSAILSAWLADHELSLPTNWVDEDSNDIDVLSVSVSGSICTLTINVPIDNKNETALDGLSGGAVNSFTHEVIIPGCSMP